MQAAKNQNIAVAWVKWHFYDVPAFLLSVYRNYLNFGLYYFSIPLLARTFFSPWRKYQWNYPKGLNIGEMLAVLVSNLFSRLMGALSRIVLIIAGSIFEMLIAIFGAVIVIVWVLIPLLIVAIIVMFSYV